MGKGNANAGFVMTHEGASENLTSIAENDAPNTPRMIINFFI